jgi:hypothetical protein
MLGRLRSWLRARATRDIDPGLLDAVRNPGETDEARLYNLAKVARHILPGLPLHWPQMDWMEDAEFRAFLHRFDEHEGFNCHRRLALRELHRLAAGTPGDTAECGVWKGAGSWLICDGNRRSGRVHYAFDSFEGLSEPSPAHDGPYWSRGNLRTGEAEARRNLEEFGDAVRILAGWIPSRFTEVAERRFSFVHIDVDLFEPTRDSIAFFHPRLSEGGVIVCDDYGFTTCPGATKAVDEYLQANGLPPMVRLPTGGGFLIKRRAGGSAP